MSEVKDYKEKINEFFNPHDFYEECNLLRTSFPKELYFELEKFVSACREIKDHPLGYLKFHNNDRKTSFQVSVPVNIFQTSFTFAYLNHLGEFFINRVTGKDYHSIRRQVTIKGDAGHFDRYDFWTVFSYKNDSNPVHRHRADISGIIYYTDSDIPTKFFLESGKELNVYGSKGDVVIFPAHLYHTVDIKHSEEERITLPFNLNYSG